MSIKEKIKDKYIVVKFHAQTNWYKLMNWCKANPQLAAVIASSIFAGAKFVGKNAIQMAKVKKQEAVKELYCYDRSLGHYWALRRELSNKEWLEIDQRKKNGERLADILEEMRVLR